MLIIKAQAWLRSRDFKVDGRTGKRGGGKRGESVLALIMNNGDIRIFDVSGLTIVKAKTIISQTSV